MGVHVLTYEFDLRKLEVEILLRVVVMRSSATLP